MRLVFLLYAEERRLLPAEDPLWAESYSVLTLRDELRTAAARDGEDALERRSAAWHRLLATFRAVHGGANHDRLTLPAYGGSLFDPDRFPFLEGRRAPDHIVAGGIDLGPDDDAETGTGRPVAIDDRTVLAILDALLTVEVKVGRGQVAQRVSYKALDVEQIGHCYEGLLDHGCAPVDVLALGLVGPEGAEPEIRHHRPRTPAGGGARTAVRLARRQGPLQPVGAGAGPAARPPARPASTSPASASPAGTTTTPLLGCCPSGGSSAPTCGTCRSCCSPGRCTSPRHRPGATRAPSTPPRPWPKKSPATPSNRSCTSPARRTSPTREQWQLRTPDDILGLRICDPAVGSGAILTAAGRYLADRLIEAVVEHGPGDGPFAGRLTDLAAAPSEEQTLLARREVVDHCLYGVDKNPVAAEMAKLSLWLTTMARERPFTFLDHAIQVGDSLLGITDLEQLRWLHLDPAERKGTARFETLALDLRLKEATDLARRLQDLSVVTVRDASEKQRLHDELRSKLADLAIVADTVVGAALSTATSRGVSAEQRLNGQMERIRVALDDDRLEIERAAALNVLHGVSTGWLRSDLPDEIPMPWDRQCLHWPLAFPEVFLEDGRSGFDAMIANPPFLGGKRISTANGAAYREHLVAWVSDAESGSADLVTYFLLRMCSLGASVGTLATNTISQGDSREVGLERLAKNGWTIHRAVKSEPWPNEASVEIAKVWLVSRAWDGAVFLNGSCVASVTPSLEAARRVSGAAATLARNAHQSFIGSFVNGMGFVLSKDQARNLIDADSQSADVILPYLSGANVNDDPQQRPSRYVINFFDWPIERARTYAACFEIVERLVKPERAKVNRKAHRERWWIYGDKRPALYAAIDALDRVVVIVLHSPHALPLLVTRNQVFSHALAVFPYSDDAHFGLLTSSCHWWWGVVQSGTLGGETIRYNPSRAFETFPQPEPQSGPRWEAIDATGRALNEFRSDLMIRTQLGLTKTYNRVHDPEVHDPDIVRLRELHVELDHAVRDAYGWSGLSLDHHHWETPQGMRFTVSRDARDELLDRVLELNHARYGAEVAAGLHDKKGKKAPPKRTSKPGPAQETML